MKSLDGTNLDAHGPAAVRPKLEASAGRGQFNGGAVFSDQLYHQSQCVETALRTEMLVGAA